MSASKFLFRLEPGIDRQSETQNSELDTFRSFAALLEQLRHHSSPSGLVTGPDSGPVVSVKVFMKKNQVSPVWIILKFLDAAKYGSAAIGPAQEDPRQPPGKFTRHLPQGHHLAGASRAFDLEIVAEEMMKPLQRLDDQIINWKPDRTAPV